MKNISKYMLGAILGAGLTACSPETFEGISEAGLPAVQTFEGNINLNVDQNINQVTFSLDGVKEVYPVWTVNTGKKTETFTTNGAKRIYTVAGDYTVTVQIGNRNGISEGKITKTFHIDNSIVDFTQYVNKISRDPWFIDNAAAGHLGCGEPSTNGTNWWSAAPDDKKDFGVYDNSLTFTADMNYTFDPGKHGTIYVNTGCSLWPEYHLDEDFCVPVEVQQSTYNFEVDGDDLYLTFPKGTYFPYIANDDIWNTPRYRVLNLTTKAMELVADNGAIAWHYLLTTTHEVAFGGFDTNSPDNLWKEAGASFRSLYYAHGGSWEGLPDYEHSEADGKYSVILPTATDMQWQAQYQLSTNLSNANVPADASYDFSCIFVSNNDVPGVTIKLTSEDDQISLINERADIQGGETVVYFTELPGQALDGNYKMVFDFGGNPDGTEITIKDIVLIDHSKNTITPPAKEQEPEQPEVNVSWDLTGEKNLWLKGEHNTLSFYYAPGWSQIADPETEIDGNSFTIILPEATSDQWQAQWHISTDLSATDIVAGKKYDIRFTIYSNEEQPGITFKLTEDGNDENFLTADRHAYKTPYEDQIVQIAGVSLTKGENTTAGFKLALDFAGNPAGSEVTIKDIIVQESAE
ncbi:MAG: hypothetical protein Q4B58_04190 [Bacteroidales bacterium]|nr:hypothetical protein [Bacteroidales bacterium]